MKTLKPYHVVEIIDEMMAGRQSVRQIAKKHQITPQWARSLLRRFRATGRVPCPRPCGCKPRPVTAQEIRAVKKAYGIYHLGAVRLEDCMGAFMDTQMPHNRIHRIMRSLKLARRQPKKSKRRKWIRYERYKSNSLWHIDWSQLGRHWLITIEDDASRFVVGWGLFDHADMDNSILVMKEAVAAYGVPKAILSGHDSQFVGIEEENVQKGPTRFQQFLQGHGIKHILARVYHPQTNGKLERAFGSIKPKVKEFASLDDLFFWYNNVRPHMSLKDGLETPAHAYARKMRKKKKIAGETVV